MPAGEHAVGLAGPGKVNWHSLVTVFSSEMLKFEEEQRLLEEAANALALERPHTPPSRKGSGNVEQLSSPRGNDQHLRMTPCRFTTCVLYPL